MTPRVYTFGPIFKTVVLACSLGLVGLGVWGAGQSYQHASGVTAQFVGIVASMFPMIIALLGLQAAWRCKLSLFDDRLEYRGLWLDTTISKADVIDVTTLTPRYGIYSILLTRAGHPFKKLHIAIFGRVDDALKGWVNALPHSDAVKA